MINFLSSHYDAANWYWNIANSNAQVFSSKSFRFVPITDQSYVDWKEAGGITTRIDSGESLYDVLAKQVIPPMLAAGIEVESTDSPDLNATYPLDPQAQNYISSISTGIAAGKGIPGGGSSFRYNGKQFTAEQFLNLASALENFVYNFNTNLAIYLETAGDEGTLPERPVLID